MPDDYHLRHVGKTAQGNGYWITLQLAVEDGGTRDFIAAYVFDKAGDLISSEVVDLGIRRAKTERSIEDIIEKLAKKIDAVETEEIWVKPFSVRFYGHRFGLVPRENELGEATMEETLIDAMPGHTLMFYSPWSLCNYAT